MKVSCSLKGGSLLVLGIVVGSLFAQNVKVMNAITKKGIENVFVYNYSKSKNALSNNEGEVDLSIFSKKDTLIFTHAAYNTFVIPKINVSNTLYMKEQQMQLSTVEVTAKKHKERALEYASKVDVIDGKDIAFNNPSTAAEMLELSGGVYIQKSQAGGGSPVIRGFEANRVLLVVDGVRMNNAIYRSGHLQNAITIDHSILEKTEIIYGPNAVIYGSDAIGGVVHYHTKVPLLKQHDTINTTRLNAYGRYATANTASSFHIDFNLGAKKIAALTSITVNDFGNIRMGAQANANYPNFGIEKYVAERSNNRDTMIRKQAIYEQLGTGYTQTDILQKLRYRFSDRITVDLNTQYSTSSNILRYDQLTEYNGEELKWAEWYYGPQNRLLISLSTQLKANNKWFNSAQIIAAYQRIDEDRFTRRFGNDNAIMRNEDVNVYTFNADFIKKNTNTSEWFYGIEVTHNDVVSTAQSQNILTLEEAIAPTRYPDNGSSLSSAGLYFSYKKNLTEQVNLSLGSRYSYNLLKASFQDTSFIQLPFSETSLSNGALTGNMGLTYNPSEDWEIQLAASTGYRAPNIDDVGKVFSKNDYVLVPNDQLVPEKAYNLEFGITKGFLDNTIKWNITGFYTLLNDAIVRQFFQLNGQDSLEYEGETLRIQANTNANRAIVQGFSTNLEATITPEFSVSSSLNYTTGENTTDNTPLGHIPPLYGRTDFIFTSYPLRASFYVKYQGWKKIADFSPGGEDNEDKATADGTPPWQTFNVNASIDLKKNIKLQAAVENLFDVHYRTFASGVSAPGRNLIVTLRVSL